MYPKDKDNKSYYWIAINGPSIAACPIPSPKMVVKPTPQKLIGVETQAEATEIAKHLLTASIPSCRQMLKTLEERKDVLIVRPAKPQRPKATTAWNPHK